MENKICPLTIAVFVKFHSDPTILDICQNIFKDLTQNPSCIEPLQTRLIPTLTSMMAITPINKSKDGTFFLLIHPFMKSNRFDQAIISLILCSFCQRDLDPLRWMC